MNKLKEFFDSIDYKELSLQKEDLITNTYEASSELIDAAMGIIHLIDKLQDTAAEIYGEDGVFMFKKKAEYMLKYRQYCNDNEIRDDSMYLSSRELFDFVEKEILTNEPE